jgi:hypothetical protein
LAGLPLLGGEASESSGLDCVEWESSRLGTTCPRFFWLRVTTPDGPGHAVVVADSITSDDPDEGSRVLAGGADPDATTPDCPALGSAAVVVAEPGVTPPVEPEGSAVSTGEFDRGDNMMIGSGEGGGDGVGGACSSKMNKTHLVMYKLHL